MTDDFRWLSAFLGIGIWNHQTHYRSVRRKHHDHPAGAGSELCLTVQQFNRHGQWLWSHEQIQIDMYISIHISIHIYTHISSQMGVPQAQVLGLDLHPGRQHTTLA